MNNLKKYRENAGLSQLELSKLTGCARSYICEVESGDQKMSLKMAERMSAVLHQSARAILGGDVMKYSGGFPDALKGLVDDSYDEVIDMQSAKKISPRDFNLFMICFWSTGESLTDDDVEALKVMAETLKKAHGKE